MNDYDHKIKESKYIYICEDCRSVFDEDQPLRLKSNSHIDSQSYDYEICEGNLVEVKIIESDEKVQKEFEAFMNQKNLVKL